MAASQRWSAGRLLRPAAVTSAATCALVVALLHVMSPGPLLAAAKVDVTWTDMANMTWAVGETSAGILMKNDQNEPLLVVVGHAQNNNTASAATMMLDINTNTWSRKADRLYKGHHIAAATVGNKLYLIGGYLNGSTFNMQIYDPVTDTWTRGAPPIVRSGAGGAVALGRFIYHCGGIKDGNTNNGAPLRSCNRYSVDNGTWSSIASMPQAVHHASMGTDGSRIFVIGGRNSYGNNALQPVNFTQIYNPVTNTWRASTQAGGPAPLPVGRGGMGALVYLSGHLYALGGEVRCTTSIPCPNLVTGLSSRGVYNRVDRYNPETNIWDRGLPGMAVPRHGAHPVVASAPGQPDSTVAYVCGGGVVQGYSENANCQYMSVPV